LEGEILMPSMQLFNNIGIDALALAFVMGNSGPLSISKALLISPIVSHKALLNHLARKTTKILSFEKYLIENIEYFANFNNRYYAGMAGSVNAIQLLCELEAARLRNGIVHLVREIEFNKKMGLRAEKISKAAPNIAKLISQSEGVTYLNLRIEV
jgi:hypothetical protein